MSHLLSDLRYALRSLRAHPAFSLTAVLTLGIGIGITTAMFGVVDGIVLKPLDFPAADRLVTVCTEYPGSSPAWCSVSPPNIEDIAARSRTIEAIGLGRTNSWYLRTPRGQVAITGGIATPAMFRALGVRAARGRLLEDSDLLGRESDVAVLTHELWLTQFAADPGIVGRSVVLDDHPVTIVGVLDSGVTIPRLSYARLWRPLDFDPRDETNRGWPGFVAFGRLRAGVSIEVARADLASITADLKRRHFASTATWGLSTQSVQDLVVGRIRPILLVFLGAVCLVLLIACANVANLLLARSVARAREIGVRVALGAARSRIAVIVLVESLVLALGGAALGVIIAQWGTLAFAKFAPPGIPRIENVRVDLRVLTFALAVSAATAIIFGLVPALRASRFDPVRTMRDGGRSMAARRSRTGTFLVAAEVALTLVLVSGAGLLARSFASVAGWNPGFEREHVLTFSLMANMKKHSTRASLSGLWNDVENQLRAVPGVVDVGSTSAGPLFGGGDGAAAVVLPDGRQPPGASADWFNVSPGYFKALGVPIVAGADITDREAVAGPRRVLVNETFARRYLASGGAVGRRFALRIGSRPFDAEIVGVVRDVPPITPGVPVSPEVYWSDRAEPRGFSFFLVRTSVPPAGVLPAIRARLDAMDPDLSPGNVQTMPELVDAQLTSPRFYLMLVSAFAAAALVLAAVGTYGLFAYVVSGRTRELGIRLALGAAPRRLAGSVVAEGLRVTLAGLAVGGAAAVLASRALRSSVPGVSALDPVTLGVSVAILVVVAAAACLVPARRAAGIDPAVTLSTE